MKKVFVALLLLATSANADWLKVADEWSDYKFNRQDREWFRSVGSARTKGSTCCNLADGHRTKWTSHSGDGRYWVEIMGKEYPVPVEAIVTQPSPISESIVWYRMDWVDNNDETKTPSPYIRCFSPGSGG